MEADKVLNFSSLQFLRCMNNIQETRGGAGVKWYLSSFDVFQGQGNGGVGKARGGSAHNFRQGLSKVDKPVNGRNWVPLELSTGQNYGGVVYPIARGLFGEKGNGKGWATSLELGNNQNLGGAVLHPSACLGISSETRSSKNWPSNKNGMDNGLINLESSHGEDSPSSEVLMHLMELESQLHRLRGEYSDQKKALSHLATFIQISNTEIRIVYNKMKEYFEVLARKMDNCCPFSGDINTQINSVHNSLKVVEAKLDGMKSNIKINSMVFHGNDEENAGTRNGNKENIGHQCST